MILGIDAYNGKGVKMVISILHCLRLVVVRKSRFNIVWIQVEILGYANGCISGTVWPISEIFGHRDRQDQPWPHRHRNPASVEQQSRKYSQNKDKHNFRIRNIQNKNGDGGVGIRQVVLR